MTAPSEGGANRFGDFAAMWRGTRGLCPGCGSDGVFTSLWGVAPVCPSCGVRFERESGAWVGAWVLAYTVAMLVLVVVAAALIINYGLFPGLEWILVATGIVTVLVAYRPVKGWWLWWMWAAGFVTRDGEDEAAAR